MTEPDHVDVPEAGRYAGEPVPDLSQIPSDRWPEVLGRISSECRRYAIRTAPYERRLELTAMALELPEPVRRRTPVDGLAAPPPVPRAEARRTPRRTHQVNTRLTAEDHDLLLQASEVTGLRPTELARALIVSGARAALAREG